MGNCSKTILSIFETNSMGKYVFLWFRFFSWNTLPNCYAAVHCSSDHTCSCYLYLFIYLFFLLRWFLPFCITFYIATSNFCHKCTTPGTQSGCLGTETFSVIMKGLPNYFILLSLNFHGLRIDSEQIFFLFCVLRLTVIKIFPIATVFNIGKFLSCLNVSFNAFFSLVSFKWENVFCNWRLHLCECIM